MIMNTNSISELKGKAEFEPAEIEVIIFDTKTDIICSSAFVGEDDMF